MATYVVNNRLGRQAFLGGGFLLVIIWLGLFLPAGSLSYWQGWVFWLVFSVSVTLITIYLMKNDPALLQRRVSAGPVAEKQKYQKIIQLFSSLAFIGLIVLPGLDYRFHWSKISLLTSLTGDFYVALGLFIVFEVFRSNSFTSGIIEVSEKQKVISTGPYAVVRHPMYAGALIMCIAIPLALGSVWDLIFSSAMVFTVILRLLDEEKYLSKNLPGYFEYCRKVRFHLIPFVW
jgi:protein-S-isoprenylcysteine O-methyltransferase Ste14